MEYFSSFPAIVYNGNTMVDITARVDFLHKIKDNVSLYNTISIQDGQRPEDIAYQYLGDSTLYWIILYLNDIINPYYDWPLTDARLYDYVQNKYGVDQVYSTLWYVTTAESPLGAGVIVDEGTPFCSPVTNYDYEYNLNEVKRNIRIIKASYVPQILAEYQNAF